MLEVDRPAVVLGSTQPGLAVDDPAFEVVRRRSGGGAVVLRPGTVVWIDVVVPAGDRLWAADVGRAFWWLGQTWVETLAAVGVTGARWHDGPLLRSRWSDQVCFAGLGPGEVTLGGRRHGHRHRRKVVGLSQRRRRDAALFQCAALLSWDPAEVASVLGLGPEAGVDLADVAAGLDVAPAELLGAFREALARR